ncbi:mitochondrial import inner membrane translocase subunit Tim54 [Dipodascopsis uninucleata]
MSTSSDPPKNTPEGQSPSVNNVDATNIEPKQRGYSNPALKALGIPRLRLPSRNMSIFLMTVLGISGAIYYDRAKRRENRQKWKDAVSFMAHEPLAPNAMPRKVKVYIAPPPGDHIDITKEHFTQYVKPILTAAAIDWELVEESRQGEIRYKVAEEIRKQRRGDRDTDEVLESVTKHLIRDTEGGIICVGRGAYKEYLHGINEGWLGPLEKPDLIHDETEKPIDTTSVVETAEEALNKAELSSKNAEQGVTESQKPVESESSTESKEEDKSKKTPVPKPYIQPEQYRDAATPDELSKTQQLEPVAYVPHPHILGVRNTPIRIYRFFNKRELADQVGRATASAALGKQRTFIPLIDKNQGIEEENEWPPKWKETALEKNSEWMQDIVIDDRIAERLRVYELPPGLEQNSPVEH